MKTFLNACYLLMLLWCFACEEKFDFTRKEIEGEFIEATIAGVTYNFTHANAFDPNDFLIDTNRLSNTITLFRSDVDDQQFIEISLFDLDPLTTDFPVELVQTPNQSPVLMLFSDNGNRFSNPDELFASQGLTVQILNWDEDSFMEGNFSGVLFSRAVGDELVENGSFRIRVLR